MLGSADSDREDWLFWVLRVKKDEADTEDPRQCIESRNIVFGRVVGNSDVGFMTEQTAGSDLAECRD
jgi:hypothetical protein